MLYRAGGTLYFLEVQKVRDLQLLQLITSATRPQSTMTWHYPESRGRALSSRTFICCVKEFLHFLSFLYPEFQATASAYRQALNIALGTWSRGGSIMLEIRSRNSYLGVNTTRHLLMLILPTGQVFHMPHVRAE